MNTRTSIVPRPNCAKGFAAAKLAALLCMALFFAGFFDGGAAAQAGLEVAPRGVELQQEVFSIARQLRCPTCISETVADSEASFSIEMRTMIRDQLLEGRSEAEILAFFQERYGDWILLNPPRRGVHLVVWILPVAAGLVAAAVAGLFVRRWLREAAAPIEASEEDIERVRRKMRELSEGASGRA